MLYSSVSSTLHVSEKQQWIWFWCGKWIFILQLFYWDYFTVCVLHLWAEAERSEWFWVLLKIYEHNKWGLVPLRVAAEIDIWGKRSNGNKKPSDTNWGAAQVQSVCTHKTQFGWISVCDLSNRCYLMGAHLVCMLLGQFKVECFSFDLDKNS